MISSQELADKVKIHYPNLNEALIHKAYNFAKEAHGNQRRHSGDSYFSHPLAVAQIVADLKLDEESVITALLHDVVEDTLLALMISKIILMKILPRWLTVSPS